MTFLNLSCHAFRAFLATLGVVLGGGVPWRNPQDPHLGFCAWCATG